MPQKLTRERLEEIKRDDDIGRQLSHKSLCELIAHAEATIESQTSVTDACMDAIDRELKDCATSYEILNELKEINANLVELQTAVRNS